MSNEVTLANGATTTREALRERVAVVEPGIVKFDEHPFGTVETLEVLGKVADELGADFDAYVLVLDLTNVRQDPSAEYRAGIVQWMRALECVHAAYVAPDSIIARVALRFMMGRSGSSVSVHKTVHEALKKARTMLAQP